MLFSAATCDVFVNYQQHRLRHDDRKRDNVRINVTLRCFRANIAATEKIEVLHTYAEYVFSDLGIQNVIWMHRIIFSSAACLSIP